MFEVKEITDKTSYFESYSNVGIYNLNEDEVLLVDSGDHIRMVRTIDKFLMEKGKTVRTIVNTHCHVDHICGNKYFQDKYGCEIFSSDLERNFIEYPSLEPTFYYSGIPTDKSLNPFFNTTVSHAKTITDDVLPEGFEIISLPGHSFDMIGIRTDDDVVFLADSILSRATMDKYKLPFFFNINDSIATLEMLKTLKGSMFVPAHDVPTENIVELADYNIFKIKEKKEMIFDLCDSTTFEKLFDSFSQKLELKMPVDKYPMFAVVVKNYLQSLVDDGRITAQMNGYNIVYKKI